MSKKRPGQTDSAKGPRPDKMKDGDRAADDPVAEELPAPDEQAPCESEQADAFAAPAESEIEALRTELNEANERALRIHAELENYRKRVARQIDDERRYANLPLIRDLLPVWDNVGRAIQAAEKTHQTASLLEGFKMVAGQLEDVLQRHHCTMIDALGEPFDPNLHEAISQQPTDEYPANTVLQVVQTGFRLYDRVVRPSQVIVSVAASQAPRNEQSPEAPTDKTGEEDKHKQSGAE